MEERKLVKISDEDELESLDGGFELSNDRTKSRRSVLVRCEGKERRKERKEGDEHVPSKG